MTAKEAILKIQQLNLTNKVLMLSVIKQYALML